MFCVGHPLSEPFWKLPSKRYYPDYYKEIKNPVSLSQIRNKLKVSVASYMIVYLLKSQ
jgi:DNA-binding cell septation regulator SpoVG